ncbi:MAG: glycosyltransferase family 4 protein [Actinomycetota bacterium]|nr:glycosyltransferase family 4 protein [Actinomycetota bacterium]
MRIAEVAPPWIAVPPKGYGGIEWVVSLVADGLAEHGHDVTLFATGDSTTKARLEYVFEHAPGATWINSVYHDTVHALHAFRDPGRFDLYHLHVPWAALVAGTLCGRPIVLTVHGSINDRMRDLFDRVGDRAWFVAISESQRRQMEELRYAGVVYNGIDLEQYPFQADKDEYLLFLGRAAPEKGLLRAVLTAKKAGLPLVLALKMADPHEREHWERDAKPHLPPGTVVHDEIDHEGKVELLARARAVLFPIDWEEPFGLVMTEAMACGTPVIATPRGSVPEVIADGETGFIVPVEDYPAAAVECLGRLDEIDPKACRARVERLFSKEAMVQGYERAFERVLAEES